MKEGGAFRMALKKWRVPVTRTAVSSTAFVIVESEEAWAAEEIAVDKAKAGGETFGEETSDYEVAAAEPLES